MTCLETFAWAATILKVMLGAAREALITGAAVGSGMSPPATSAAIARAAALVRALALDPGSSTDEEGTTGAHAAGNGTKRPKEFRNGDGDRGRFNETGALTLEGSAHIAAVTNTTLKPMSRPLSFKKGGMSRWDAAVLKAK